MPKHNIRRSNHYFLSNSPYAFSFVTASHAKDGSQLVIIEAHFLNIFDGSFSSLRWHKLGKASIQIFRSLTIVINIMGLTQIRITKPNFLGLYTKAF